MTIPRRGGRGGPVPLPRRLECGAQAVRGGRDLMLRTALVVVRRTSAQGRMPTGPQVRSDATSYDASMSTWPTTAVPKHGRAVLTRVPRRGSASRTCPGSPPQMGAGDVGLSCGPVIVVASPRRPFSAGGPWLLGRRRGVADEVWAGTARIAERAAGSRRCTGSTRPTTGVRPPLRRRPLWRVGAAAGPCQGTCCRRDPRPSQPPRGPWLRRSPPGRAGEPAGSLPGPG